jgi:hypothetical protein
MKYTRTSEFTYNVRRGQFAGLTLEQYHALIRDEAVELDEVTAKQMQEQGWIVPAKGEKP